MTYANLTVFPSTPKTVVKIIAVKFFGDKIFISVFGVNGNGVGYKVSVTGETFDMQIFMLQNSTSKFEGVCSDESNH